MRILRRGEAELPTLLDTPSNATPTRTLARDAYPGGLPALLRIGDVVGQVLEKLLDQRLPRRSLADEGLEAWARRVRRAIGSRGARPKPGG